MRDTDKRARQPFPDAPESMAQQESMAQRESMTDPMSDPMSSPPVSTVETEPIPADEAGLERGGTVRDAPGLDEPMAGDERMAGRRTGGAQAEEPMFADDVADRLRTRWRELQADFVDDPERAVRAADDVVDEMMKTITERRQRLTGEWQGHTDTEELRLALRGYRSFFDTLLPH